MTEPRIIAWFSCGAASAVAAKLAINKWGGRVRVVYCDTLAAEHTDNTRFFKDIQDWLGTPILTIRSDKYQTIDDVFEQTRFMSGRKGARCTVEMKKRPRFEFQEADDIHVFGLTADEGKRIERFEQNNPELTCEWVLRDAFYTKARCLSTLSNAGIATPVMYDLGYKNNNCIGCVKATSPKYWNRVRETHPEVFERRAVQSRAIGCRLARFKGKRVFLDELPVMATDGRMPNISCGPQCGGEKLF